ncbi:MAG: hypothetical protein ACOYOS_15075 [Syntrophales bacterium]
MIAPTYLHPIEVALAACEQWVQQETIPLIGEEYRLMQMDWLLRSGKWTHAKWRLSEAIKDLSANWSECLAEARTRLGKKFVFDDYPLAAAFETNWRAELECDWENVISSLTLLQEYSKYYVPPHDPTIWDAITYGGQLEKAP